MLDNLRQNYHGASNMFQTQQEIQTQKVPTMVVSTDIKVPQPIPTIVAPSHAEGIEVKSFVQTPPPLHQPLQVGPSEGDSGSGLGMMRGGRGRGGGRGGRHHRGGTETESLLSQDSLASSTPSLPVGWREAYTPEGQKYYIDDIHQTTSWTVPS